MEIVPLWPFSQGEIEGTIEGFIDAAFGDAPPELGRVSPSAHLTDRVLRGGYPEALPIASAERRGAWFDSYVTTILQRDVRDLARIEGLTELPRLLALLASRPMALLNYADLSRGTGMPQSTLKRYFALLETIFLIHLLPPWYTNIGKRLVKTPKVLIMDTGLAAHLMGIDDARLAQDRTLLGGLMEGFVAMELVKQSGWSANPPALYHFRTHEGEEVDLVLERRGGALVGIEVKCAATVSAEDFKGLRVLAEIAGRRFRRGIVLYTGAEVVPFGAGLFAMPVEALWRWNKLLPKKVARR
jgi:predicted AAA+ superfamily ATPase